MSIEVQPLTRAIQEVVGIGPVSLHEPWITQVEIDSVNSCMTTGLVSAYGPATSAFEDAICQYAATKFALATSSGTAALHLALLGSGVLPEDEVLMPSLTFVASANAVKYCGAWPHFVDVTDLNLGIDATRLRAHLSHIARRESRGTINRQTGRRMSVLLPVHALGLVADVEDLLEVAEDFGLNVVEDAAEAVGSLSHDRHAGTCGRVGVLSFNGNKTITTGGGGALLTSDQSLAEEVRHIGTTAKRPHRWEYWHDRTGFNYRMPSLNASLGLAQLSRINELIKAKRRLHDNYGAALAGIPQVKLISERSGTRSNYWLNAIRIPGMSRGARNKLLESLNTLGIGARPLWTLQHRLPMFAASPRDQLHVSELMEDEIICLPSSAQIVGAN